MSGRQYSLLDPPSPLVLGLWFNFISLRFFHHSRGVLSSPARWVRILSFCLTSRYFTPSSIPLPLDPLLHLRLVLITHAHYPTQLYFYYNAWNVEEVMPRA